MTSPLASAVVTAIQQAIANGVRAAHRMAWIRAVAVDRIEFSYDHDSAEIRVADGWSDTIGEQIAEGVPLVNRRCVVDVVEGQYFVAYAIIVAPVEDEELDE